MLIALLSAVAIAPQAPTPPPSPPLIVVQAAGRVDVPADRAVFTVNVEARDSLAARAAQINATRMRPVLDTLRAMGLRPDSLATSNYRVGHPDRWDNGETEGTDYRAVNGIEVSTADVRRVGDILDAALAKGATEIANVQFVLANDSAARRVATARALENAKRSARAIAAGAGGHLGRLVEVRVNPDPFLQEEDPRDYSGVAAVGRGFASLPRTPITPGTVTVRVTLQASWEFVPGSGN